MRWTRLLFAWISGKLLALLLGHYKWLLTHSIKCHNQSLYRCLKLVIWTVCVLPLSAYCPCPVLVSILSLPSPCQHTVLAQPLLAYCPYPVPVSILSLPSPCLCPSPLLAWRLLKRQPFLCFRCRSVVRDSWTHASDDPLVDCREKLIFKLIEVMAADLAEGKASYRYASSRPNARTPWWWSVG